MKPLPNHQRYSTILNKHFDCRLCTIVVYTKPKRDMHYLNLIFELHDHTKKKMKMKMGGKRKVGVRKMRIVENGIV